MTEDKKNKGSRRQKKCDAIRKKNSGKFIFGRSVWEMSNTQIKKLANWGRLKK